MKGGSLRGNRRKPGKVGGGGDTNICQKGNQFRSRCECNQKWRVNLTREMNWQHGQNVGGGQSVPARKRLQEKKHLLIKTALMKDGIEGGSFPHVPRPEAEKNLQGYSLKVPIKENGAQARKVQEGRGIFYHLRTPWMRVVAELSTNYAWRGQNRERF